MATSRSCIKCLKNTCEIVFDSGCVYVCVCVCVSVWGWNSRAQINDVVLKTFLSSAKFLHRYFSMKHQTFLTSRFILFAH